MKLHRGCIVAMMALCFAGAVVVKAVSSNFSLGVLVVAVGYTSFTLGAYAMTSLFREAHK